MIRRILFTTGLILAGYLLAIRHGYAQNSFCNTTNTSFIDSEKVTLRVYYNMGFIWMNAGDATFTVKPEVYKGHNVYHIVGDGKSNKSHDWIMKVRDRYESYIDKATMLPVRFIRDVHEGKTKIFADDYFDHDKLLLTNEKSIAFNITKCTQDVLSSIYFARNLDYSKFKVGDKINFDMFLDDKLYNMYIKYLGKEQMTTRNGVTYNCIKIAPLLIQGSMFQGGEKMTVWVSDDKNHIPIRIESPLTVGNVKVDLVGYDNLRNPFTSIVTEK